MSNLNCKKFDLSCICLWNKETKKDGSKVVYNEKKEGSGRRLPFCFSRVHWRARSFGFLILPPSFIQRISASY
jgi:hypothetical protein